MINWLIKNPQLCNVIISLSTIILSLLAIVISIMTYYTQKKFNQNSVKPLLEFDLVDLDERIAIKLKNYGMGVGIIKKIEFSSMNTGKSWTTLLESVEGIGENNEEIIRSRGVWKRYINESDGYSVPANGECILLEIDNSKCIDLDELRGILKEIEVKLTYTDIYNKKQNPISYDFGYFGRRDEGVITIKNQY